MFHIVIERIKFVFKIVTERIKLVFDSSQICTQYVVIGIYERTTNPLVSVSFQSKKGLFGRKSPANRQVLQFSCRMNRN